MEPFFGVSSLKTRRTFILHSIRRLSLTTNKQNLGTRKQKLQSGGSISRNKFNLMPIFNESAVFRE